MAPSAGPDQGAHAVELDNRTGSDAPNQPEFHDRDQAAATGQPAHPRSRLYGDGRDGF
jgi:hypothetical protein